MTFHFSLIGLFPSIRRYVWYLRSSSVVEMSEPRKSCVNGGILVTWAAVGDVWVESKEVSGGGGLLAPSDPTDTRDREDNTGESGDGGDDEPRSLLDTTAWPFGSLGHLWCIRWCRLRNLPIHRLHVNGFSPVKKTKRNTDHASLATTLIASVYEVRGVIGWIRVAHVFYGKKIYYLKN